MRTLKNFEFLAVFKNVCNIFMWKRFFTSRFSLLPNIVQIVFRKKANSWQPSSCALFLSQMYILYNSVLAQRMCSCISISFTQLHLVRFGLFFFLILCEFVLFHFIFCFVSTFAIIRSFRVHSLQRKTLFFCCFCMRKDDENETANEWKSERAYVRTTDRQRRVVLGTVFCVANYPYYTLLYTQLYL